MWNWGTHQFRSSNLLASNTREEAAEEPTGEPQSLLASSHRNWQVFNGRLRRDRVMNGAFPLLGSSPLHDPIGQSLKMAASCYMPIACGEFAPKWSLSKVQSEDSVLLFPGIDTGVCGESRITIRE